MNLTSSKGIMMTWISPLECDQTKLNLDGEQVHNALHLACNRPLKMRPYSDAMAASCWMRNWCLNPLIWQAQRLHNRKVEAQVLKLSSLAVQTCEKNSLQRVHPSPRWCSNFSVCQLLAPMSHPAEVVIGPPYGCCSQWLFSFVNESV